MKNQHIARGLFRRTRNQNHFTVNDFRANNFHHALDHPNQIGRFFADLVQNGFAVKIGQARAEHPEAKKRWVSKWFWTRKAHGVLGV
jgi:predicted transcriptional regulator